MRRLLRVVLVVVLLTIGLGVGNPSYAVSEGSINSYANAQRARAGAPALKPDAIMNTVALNAAKRYAAQGSITKGESLNSQIRGGWTGTQSVRQMLTTNDPAAVYAKALSGHQTVMNGRQWTAMGSGFASAGGQTYLVLLYATYPAPAPAAPPVTVDPVPAPVRTVAPAPVPAPSPKPVPAPARPVAPAPAAPAPARAPEPAPEPAPRPTKAPSRSPGPSKKAEPTAAPSKSAKPSRSPTAAPSPTPVPSVAPTPMIIERTVNGAGLTGEERHTLSALLFAGSALSGTTSALSWLVVRRLSRS